MVKSRSVRGAGKNGRATAHLRYIQRDGTSRDGERGRLYSAKQDRTDGDAFLDRGKDDRHQFRVIVSPEDGAELDDLSGFTRDLMSQLEEDLGTKLDWVAVNHFNTGHPHVHVIVNGRDELGEDLVINGDYIAHGIRERASALVTLELGPVTAIEQQRKLAAEIDQDRFTRIDRALLAEADEGLVDLRYAPADPRGISDRALRLTRLGKLEGMGLASEPAPGRWQLSEQLEPTLRELGERGDIIKTMYKVLQAEGRQRDPASFWIHDGALDADRRPRHRQASLRRIGRKPDPHHRRRRWPHPPRSRHRSGWSRGRAHRQHRRDRIGRSRSPSRRSRHCQRGGGRRLSAEPPSGAGPVRRPRSRRRP